MENEKAVEEFAEIAEEAMKETEPIVDDSAFVEGLNDGVETEASEQPEQPTEQAPDPIHEFVEGLAKENNMSTDEYLKAVEEARHQQAEQQLIEDVMYEYNVSESAAIEGIRQHREQERQKAEEQEKEAMDFFQVYERINGEKWDGRDLPKELWEIQNELKAPLKDAYQEYHNRKQDKAFLKGFDSV